LASPDFKSIETLLLELDSHLALRTHIVGYSLTVTDIIVWGVLRGNRAAHAYIKKNHLTNLSRWFRYIEEANLWIPKAVETLNLQVREKKTAKSKEGASYDIALPDTEKGVVTRFPPEPS
jgi:glutamyl-tRNA synthetase